MHCETRREWGRRVFWRAASRLVCAIGGEALDTKDPPLRPSLFLYMVLPSLLSLRSERPSKKVPHRTGGTNFKPCFAAPPSFPPTRPRTKCNGTGAPATQERPYERKQDRLGKPREEGLVEGRRRELWAKKRLFLRCTFSLQRRENFLGPSQKLPHMSLHGRAFAV